MSDFVLAIRLNGETVIRGFDNEFIALRFIDTLAIVSPNAQVWMV